MKMVIPAHAANNNNEIELNFRYSWIGDRVAWIDLDNGQSIEINGEEYGPRDEKLFWTVRLHCSEEDFDDDLYRDTNGIVHIIASDDDTEEGLIKPLHEMLDLCSEFGIHIK